MQDLKRRDMGLTFPEQFEALCGFRTCMALFAAFDEGLLLKNSKIPLPSKKQNYGGHYE